jgi:hypothetical protein
MHNVYNDASYSKIREMMTKKLQEMKEEYKDTEPAELNAPFEMKTKNFKKSA